jgi:hypothetical protein
MTRSAHHLLLLAVLMPLLLFAGSVIAGTLSCDPGESSFQQGTTNVAITGTVAQDSDGSYDSTYGHLNSSDGTVNEGVIPQLGMDGSKNGHWKYNLGPLGNNTYTLTVFDTDDDDTPVACGFTVGGFGTERKGATAAKGESGRHPEKPTAGSGPKQALVIISSVQIASANNQLYVQLRGSIASQAPDIKLLAHMVGKVTTPTGPVVKPYFANVSRSDKPQQKATDVVAEFNVTQFPAASYKVRLSIVTPSGNNGITTWPYPVTIADCGCPVRCRWR